MTLPAVSRRRLMYLPRRLHAGQPLLKQYPHAQLLGLAVQYRSAIMVSTIARAAHLAAHHMSARKAVLAVLWAGPAQPWCCRLHSQPCSRSGIASALEQLCQCWLHGVAERTWLSHDDSALTRSPVIRSQRHLGHSIITSTPL